MVFLSSIGVALLVVTISYGVFTYRRIHRLIDESAGLIERAMPYQQKGSLAAQKVLFVGDSTGVGVGTDDSALSVAGRYGAAFPDWTVDNVAVSGSRTADLVPVLRNFPNAAYQRVIIHIGGNDIVRFSSLPQLRQDIETVLAEARRISQRGPEAVFLLTAGNVANAPLFPRPLAFLWERRTRAVRALFMAASEKTGTTYVDLFIENPEADPFVLLPYRYHAKDLFHPSAMGYGLWYTQLKQKL